MMFVMYNNNCSETHLVSLSTEKEALKDSARDGSASVIFTPWICATISSTSGCGIPSSLNFDLYELICILIDLLFEF